MRYDLVIIGGGPGGYVAAIRARQHGLTAALVEKDHVGGTCLNRGCIPSKALIASAERLSQVRQAAQMGIDGIEAGGLRVNVATLMARKNSVVSGLRGGVEQLLKGYGVELIRGTGSIAKPGVVMAGGRELAAKQIVIATGSAWRSLPSLPVDGQVVVASDHLLEWEAVPPRLGIVGGGIIGCEFASMMQQFGAKVTLIEMAATLLPGEDPIVGKTLARLFAKRGIDVVTGMTVEQLGREGAAAAVTLGNSETRAFDKLLVAVGRRPLTEGLGAEALGILDERGCVVVDDRMATKVPGIFAIGDVIGKVMLAHVASTEAAIAVQNCAGGDARMRYDAIPRPIYTHPEICGVGATEAELKQTGMAYRVGRFAFAAVPKAICDGETEGQAAIYADDSGNVRGGYLIGPHATDLAQHLAHAVQHRWTAHQLAETIYSHPTFGELVKEAAEDVDGRAVHKVTIKRSET